MYDMKYIYIYDIGWIWRFPKISNHWKFFMFSTPKTIQLFLDSSMAIYGNLHRNPKNIPNIALFSYDDYDVEQR